MRPYGDYAADYLEQGYFPIPANGKMVFKNKHHGRDAPLVTDVEMSKWSRMHPSANIAARLPRDVIGIDVDAYGSKPGKETLDKLEAELGDLPETVVTTSRLDGVSGIRLYRIPDKYWSLIWPGQAGPGVDIIWHGNRYAIVWPSVHPDTGDRYRWWEQYDGTLHPIDGIPILDDLELLPLGWLDHFAKLPRQDAQADVSDTAQWINRFGSGELCDHMRTVVDRALLAMQDTAHDTARDATLAIAKDSAYGHSGGENAIAEVFASFQEAMGDRGSDRRRGASSEWRRHLNGAVRRAAAILGDATERPDDPCEAWDGPVRMIRMADPRLLAGMRTGAWLQAQRFRPLHFLVPRLVPEGLTMVAGPPKAGKSVLLLRFGLEAARGGLVFGEQCEPHQVFYLALEDSDRRLQQRSWELLGGEPIPEAFTYQTEIEPGKLINTVRAWLQKYDSGLVLIDTLGRAMERPLPGETQYERDYRLMVQIKRISDSHDKSSVLVSHHSRKSASDDWLDTVSGTNAIAGGCDTIMVINRKRSTSESTTEGVLKITGRDVDETEYAMNLVKPYGWELEGDDLTVAAWEADKRKANLGNLSTEIVEFVNDRKTTRASDISEELDITEKKATLYLGRLYDIGHIAKIKRGVYGPSQKLRRSTANYS